MKRIDLNERLAAQKKHTLIWKWFHDSTDEDLASIELDTISLSDEDFKSKYSFSKSAARDWLEPTEPKQASGNESFFAFRKPASEFKKVTITITEDTFDALKEEASYIAANYGYATKHCMDMIICAGIETSKSHH